MPRSIGRSIGSPRSQLRINGTTSTALTNQNIVWILDRARADEMSRIEAIVRRAHVNWILPGMAWSTVQGASYDSHCATEDSNDDASTAA